MTDEELMRLAIEEAKLSKEPLKCGVVIAKDGKVISKTYNSQREDNNATFHAEIKAIGLAGKHLKTKNLNGGVAYCTCEPCIMCKTALFFAKIEKIYYGSNLKNEKIYNISMVRNFLVEECDKINNEV
jgi:tRNA(Arg) A34 adenosine deaminase TadA